MALPDDLKIMVRHGKKKKCGEMLKKKKVKNILSLLRSGISNHLLKF